MRNIKEFQTPTSLDEAHRLLAAGGDRAVTLAGGTSLSLSRDPGMEILVDITRLGLSYIAEDGGGIRIGAATTITQMVESPLLRNLAGGLLCRTARHVGPCQVRNASTLGGNVMACFLWCDLPAALLVLDATMTITGATERVVAAKDFFAQHPRNLLASGELLTSVFIPHPPAGAGAEFIKFTRTRTEYSILDLAALVVQDGATCTRARLAVSAAVALPQRLDRVTSALEGKPLTAQAIDQAAREARKAIKPISNIRAGAEYRSELIEVLTRRALTAAAGGTSKAR